MKNKNKIVSFFAVAFVIVFVFGFVSLHTASADPGGDVGGGTSGLVPCNGVVSSNGAGGLKNGECTFNDLIALFNNIIRFLLFGLAAPLATVSFVYAGFLYVTAAGDTGKISKAHDIFKNVLIGLVLAFGAFLIVTAILKGLETDPNFYNKVLDTSK